MADTTSSVDLLVLRWAAADREVRRLQEVKEEIELELRRRMEETGAQELYLQDWVVKTERRWATVAITKRHKEGSEQRQAFGNVTETKGVDIPFVFGLEGLPPAGPATIDDPVTTMLFDVLNQEEKTVAQAGVEVERCTKTLERSQARVAQLKKALAVLAVPPPGVSETPPENWPDSVPAEGPD